MIRRAFLALLVVIPFVMLESLSAQTPDTTSQGLRKFDEYSDIRGNDAKARLDNFAIELQNTPDARGYIIGYGGSRCPNTAQAHANYARSYMVSNRGLDRARLVTINGGRRSDANTYAIELWFVPQGVPPPSPSPTLAKRCR